MRPEGGWSATSLIENDTLLIRALGVIEPGPNARRSPTSFFQDGEYQTEVFRQTGKAGSGNRASR